MVENETYLREMVQEQKKLIRALNVSHLRWKERRSEILRIRALLTEARDYLGGEPNEATRARLFDKLNMELHSLPDIPPDEAMND